MYVCTICMYVYMYGKTSPVVRFVSVVTLSYIYRAYLNHFEFWRETAYSPQSFPVTAAVSRAMQILKSLLAQWPPTSPVFTTSSPGLFPRLIFKGIALGTRLRFLSTGCRTAIIRAESFNQDGRPMLTYWSTRLCSR